MPTPDTYTAALAGLEADTTARIVWLLRQARDRLQKRLESLPAEYAEAEVITALLRANEQSLAVFEKLAAGTLQDAVGQAATIGKNFAVSALPKAESLVTFSLNPFVVRQAALYGAQSITGLTQDVRQRVAQQVQLAVLSGTPRAELAKAIVGEGVQRVGTFLSAEHRAEAIAVTEVNGVFNEASFARYEDAATRIPELQKEWLTAKDGRVRESHAVMQGVRVPVAEAFSVGGESAMHPGDRSLSARQRARCRCRAISFVPEEPEEA